MIKIALFTLLTVSICVSWAGWSVIQFNKYGELVCEKSQQIAADKAYYDTICTVPETMVKLQATADCLKKEHSLHKTPESMAWAELVQDWGACMGYNCVDSLAVLHKLPLIMIALWGMLSIAIVCIIIICGKSVTSAWNSTPLPLSLPGQTKKKKLI